MCGRSQSDVLCAGVNAFTCDGCRCRADVDIVLISDGKVRAFFHGCAIPGRGHGWGDGCTGKVLCLDGSDFADVIRDTFLCDDAACCRRSICIAEYTSHFIAINYCRVDFCISRCFYIDVF